MAIPKEHQGRFVYHFTHIDNLPRILKDGFVSNSHPKFKKSLCRSIAEPGIQARRAAMDVTCSPFGKVHDYVPLYFGSLSPMLLGVVNRKNVDQMDILYFEFPITLLERNTVVFTDASANTGEPPSFYSEIKDLENLNWMEIDSKRWKCDSDELRHQRMAEILVHSQLAVTDATSVVVWNDSVKRRVEEIVKKAGAAFPTISFESPQRRHWFINFFDKGGRNKASLVIGPGEIATRYRAASEEVVEKANKSEDAPFQSLSKLLDALRTDFSVLPQTAELIGLKSANGMHKRTVDVHTQEVVNKLKSLPEFKALTQKQRNTLELAALLHDIGKGPKSRWTGGVQEVDPDHPVGALPMLVDILTNKVATVEVDRALLLLKLVCYHDLVGEVLGKGRNEQQIIDIVDSQIELDMLFALGKADARSLVDLWFNDAKSKDLYDRCLPKIEMKQGI
ncbi:hypothetical protein BH10ACI4_BH10ACI4_11430 [soil metagenome]